ncbi:MAG: hypothetical protein Kow0099_17160 [Candidatus Abyssubacteria bacterium]
MHLALNQGIDTAWLVKKAAEQVSLLKQDSEALNEEELSQTAGQVLAYFETVSEARLELDRQGLSLVRDFIAIFKDAMGDAAPGVRALDTKKLDAWETSYQALMAQMKPIERPVPSDDAEAEPAEPTDVADFETAGVSQETLEDTEQVEEHTAAVEMQDQPQLLQEEDVESTVGQDQAAKEESADLEQTRLETETVATGEQDLKEADDLEDIPLYDPAQHKRARDAVIQDAEVKSAREFIELGKPMPHVAPRAGSAAPREPVRALPSSGKIGTEREKIAKSPVQLEEVERLKRKLLELHEKQEMLSSKMSGILGGIKKAVGDSSAQEEPSVETMDVEQLENIIFIGREKG